MMQLSDTVKPLVSNLYLSINTWIISLMLCGLLWLWWGNPFSHLPPGPKGVPLLGSLPYFDKFMEKLIKKWSLEKYGPVMSVRILHKLNVYLNTYEAMNEAFVKQSASFSGRPKIRLFEQILGGYGIIFRDYSDDFKRQKQFGLTTLKHFATGKRGVESINHEIEILVKHLKELGEKPVDLRMIFVATFANIASRATLGKRFEYSDVKFGKMIETLHNEFGTEKEFVKISMIGLLPLLRFIPPFSGAFKRFVKKEQNLFDELQLIIDEHKETFDKENTKDFIDAYFYEQKYGIGIADPAFSDEQLLSTVKDLLMAGTETTSGSMYWAVLALLLYPEYHEMLKKEVDSVLDYDEAPSMTLKSKMPLTFAFIQELWRLCPPTFIGAPHKTQNPVEIYGYRIPKGITVFANIWGIHYDPNVWLNPTEFRPGRHIDSNGKFIPSNKIVPFSIGPRFCMGESLARMETFLVFVNLLRSFNITAASPLPSLLDGQKWLTYKARSYKVILTERQ